MNVSHICTLHSTVERLLHSLIQAEKENPLPETRERLLDFLDLLNYLGCDFYDLLSIYVQADNFTEKDLSTILRYAPKPQAIYPPEPKYIRQSIPRWTASKYHTAPISDILLQIEQTIHTNRPGLYTYNSNLNPHSRRSLNDLYVLIIAGGSVRWFDINRKTTYAFVQAGKGD